MELPKTARLIKDSVDHWVDTNGDVYAIDKRNGRKNALFKKSQHERWGYKYCSVKYNNGEVKSRRVHRLVAEAFIPNPDNLPVVGHRNNIKSDNRVENLYWTTTKENTQKAYNDGLIVNDKGFDDSQSMPVHMFETKTNKLIGTYGSIKEASRETGIGATTISRQARYKRPVRKQYYFRFIDDEDCASTNRLIECFSFETDELLGVYYNCADASNSTGVGEKTICYQVLKNEKPKWVKHGMYFKLSSN